MLGSSIHLGAIVDFLSKHFRESANYPEFGIFK